MPNLLQDIQKQSDWIVKAFKSDKLPLDYSIHSFIQIDRFFNKHAKDGKAVKGGRLATNLSMCTGGTSQKISLLSRLTSRIGN
jgi:hypothetical protein